MKKNLNLLSLMLIMALLLALFAGCKNTSTSPNTENTTPTNGTVGESATLAPEDAKPHDPSSPSEEQTAPSELPMPSEPSTPDDPSEPVPPTDPTEQPPDLEPEHEHSYVAAIIPASCTEDGYTEYACECGDTYSDAFTAPMGHIWNEWAETKPATENAEGEERRACTNCSEHQTRSTPKVIPNHEHSYSARITRTASCTQEGVETYTCECGHVYNETVAKLPHSYTNKVVKATCTEKGYTRHECSVCGYKYDDTYTSKLPHSYEDIVVKATCQAGGYTKHECSKCGHNYKDAYTDVGDHDYVWIYQCKYYLYHEVADIYECTVCGDEYWTDEYPMPEDEFDAFCRAVEAAIVKYLNQYRVEQGDTEMEYLPGMSKVAQYRAVQLSENFRHSATELREAHAYYEYGKWIDATKYGDDASKSYWSSNCKEAICSAGAIDDADAMARSFVNCFRNSSGHWAYLGSSEYEFVGVGVYFSPSGAFCCILQPDANYG